MIGFFQGRFMRLSVLLSVLLVVLHPNMASANAVVFFNTSVEDGRLMPGETAPSQEVMRQILNSLDNREALIEYLDDCMEEQNMPRSSYQEMFRATLLPGLGPSSVYFVRPALNPFCGAFYGANSFRFWLVRTDKVLFEYDATDVSVMKTIHDGLPDLEISGCWAIGCHIEFLRYKTNAYKPIRCQETSFLKDGTERKRAVRCKKESS